jgi:protein SCO1/2
MRLDRDYLAKVQARKPAARVLASLATIAVVAAAGSWLGVRLDPLARAGGRVFGPRAMPDFLGRDQDGNPIAAPDLGGHVLIGNFIFTRCQGVCPTLTAAMIGLQRALSSPEIRFISFSLDPDDDTPAVLGAYARRWKGDRTRWKLVTLEPAGLNAMLAAIESAAPREAGNDNEPHTTRFFLADTRGLIVGTYAGQDHLAIRQLTADAAAVQR